MSERRPFRARGLALAALCGALGSSASVSAEPFWIRVAHPAPAPAAALALSESRDDRAEAQRWLELGAERVRQGRSGEAVTAYGLAIAAGATDPAVYAHLGEALMAEGKLAEAEARYRDAIAAASDGTPGAARGLTQERALAHYGLAVALDRDLQPVAAREMMGRALALDPTAAVLTVAALPGSDLSFAPDGDVAYYRGLAAEVAGRRGEALSAFREFLARLPASRFAARAEAHLVALAGPGVSGAGRSARGPRVIATGTVLAAGGVAAPELDAAWHDHLALLDPCLDASPALGAAGGSVRLSIDLEIDARGRVARAAVKGPLGGAALDPELAACIEAAVKAGLRLPRPSPARITAARTELIVGFPSP